MNSKHNSLNDELNAFPGNFIQEMYVVYLHV